MNLLVTLFAGFSVVASVVLFVTGRFWNCPTDRLVDNYTDNMLHCIPGDFIENRRIFEHVYSLLEPGGVFFGATLVQRPMKEGVMSWLFMKLLNAVGLFSNRNHRLAELKSGLESMFADVEISLVGNALIFRAVR